jgi:Zn-dependent peptidase ImmA (M78 family)/DNA-binding XRE family transcriptional regulator
MEESFEQPDPRIIGQRLTEFRKAAGLTQAQAADHLGMSRPTFIAIEKGVRAAQPEELVQLATLYKRRLNEIVRPGAAVVALEPHLRANLDAAERDIEGLTHTVEELNDLATDYRELERILNAELKVVHPPEVTLPSRGDISEFGEGVASRERARLGLGDGPVHHLREILESQVGVRVFYGKMPKGISGMYAYVADLGYCVMINRLHPKTRRRVSLTHEYGHFLCDRHKPGIDLVQQSARKPRNEAFCDAFAMNFLMPRAGIGRFFHDVVETTRDFQVADLVRLCDFYGVSLEAATRRLESLGMVGRGTWDLLKSRGFSPKKAREKLGIETASADPLELLPERYRQLAVRAFQQDLITEGQLARFLRVDRLSAREIVERESTRDVGSDEVAERQADLEFSLFSEH